MEKKAKQVIVIRKDLRMRQGKAIAQGSHASLGVILKMMDVYIDKYPFDMGMGDTVMKISDKGRKLSIKNDSPLEAWLEGPFTKITVYVNSEEELLEIYEKAGDLPKVLIEDKGLTEFNGVLTKTCIAIGPAWEEDIDKITGHLKLL